MKKKISLAGLVLILILVFTGCGRSETAEYDEETLQYYSQYFISFSTPRQRSRLKAIEALPTLCWTCT